MLVEITGFIAAVRAYYRSINAKSKRKEVERILTLSDWCEHYKDKQTGRRVLSESPGIVHQHERSTAISLAQMNYDVVFAPSGVFKRDQKKFDVYLLRDTVILEADLKCISSKNPLTIAYRIREGSDQASRVVIDIVSDIDNKTLIQGLRSGIHRNHLIREIFLFYRRKFYRLPKSLIESKRIFDILKSEKGYT